MQSTLTYRFETDENPELEAIRITVKTLTMAGVGQHAKLLREAIEMWRVDTNNPEFGKEVSNNGKEEEEGRPEGVLTPKEPTREEEVLYNHYARWAVIASATVDKVLIVKRGKTTKELDEDNTDSWPWETTSTAAMGWDKPSGILDIPIDLFTAWEKQAYAVNPGLFGPAGNNVAKKKGVGLISVI
jgi:hypothetical protein